MLARFVQYFIRNPKKLFLADAIGAIITALSWLTWKLLLADQFKFHIDVLHGLIFYAIAMVSASLQFYFFAQKDFGRCLKFLIFGNTGFIIVLIHLLYFFWNEISIFPRIYMIFECIIVSILVFGEIKIRSALNSNQH
jgi:hypothetical protein